MQDKTYTYTDEYGHPLYRITRTPEKKFFARHFDPTSGQWVKGMGGVRRVPYRLTTSVFAALPPTPVFIVEGEKDADRLCAEGLLATTSALGAGSWTPELGPYFAGRVCVVLPDNDKVGLDHAMDVAESVHQCAYSVKVVRLPGLAEKGDVSDWLDAGGTGKRLLQICEEAELFVPVPKPLPAPPKFRNEPLTDKPDVYEIALTMTVLEQRHDGWWGCCPFHGEKTPSFKVFRDRRGFYCFGCHKRGDGFDLLAFKTGKPFKEIAAEMREKVDPGLIQAARELIRGWIAVYNAFESMQKMSAKSQRREELRGVFEEAKSTVICALGSISTQRESVRGLDLGRFFRSCPDRVRDTVEMPISDQIQKIMHLSEGL